MIKGFEWNAKFHHGIYPTVARFWNFYFTMTGLHAVHLIVGAILAREVGRAFRDRGQSLHYPLIVAAGYTGLMVWHGGLSGSALMRDLDHAMTLVEATLSAARVPVTLKMRLGWDHGSMNAPELARRAEQAGVAMVTVHGRTRCQFYGGRADWSAIAKVREAIAIPLVANGDCQSAEDAREMMRASGADAAMIGRGAYGRPWWPGVIAGRIDAGSGISEPELSTEAEMAAAHHASIIEFYGEDHGNRIARKHVGWMLDRLAERLLLSRESAAVWRSRLLQTKDNASVAGGLRTLYAQCGDRVAA